MPSFFDAMQELKEQMERFGLVSFCGQVCGGGECGSGRVCQFGLDHITQMPAEPDVCSPDLGDIEFSSFLTGCDSQTLTPEQLKAMESEIPY